MRGGYVAHVGCHRPEEFAAQGRHFKEEWTDWKSYHVKHFVEEGQLKGILKLPLIVAVVVIVLRIVVERAGAPAIVANLFSVVALHTVLVPIYFAIILGKSGAPRPYPALFKSILAYVLATRAMLLVVYWMARIFGWQESRFAGLSESTPLIGFIAIPFLTAAFWIVASLVVGGAIGSAILAATKRRPATTY
jgi:hypothetical protein